MGLLLYDPVNIISPMGISTPMGMVPKIKGLLSWASSTPGSMNMIRLLHTFP